MSASLLVRDLRRLLSVPAPWVVLALSAAAAALTSLALAAVHSGGSGAAALSALPMLAGLFGAVAVGAEYRFGTLHAEVLLHGGRRRLWLPLAVAVGTVGSAVGVAGALVAVVLTRAAAGAAGIAAPTRFVVVAALVAACWALIGAGLAVLVANQVAAVAGLLCYLVMVEPLLEAAARGFADLLPARVSADLLSVPSWDVVGGGALRLIAVTALVCVLAGAALCRRDIVAVAA